MIDRYPSVFVVGLNIHKQSAWLAFCFRSLPGSTSSLVLSIQATGLPKSTHKSHSCPAPRKKSDGDNGNQDSDKPACKESYQAAANRFAKDGGGVVKHFYSSYSSSEHVNLMAMMSQMAPRAITSTKRHKMNPTKI
jgi:hypothetical protein